MEISGRSKLFWTLGVVGWKRLGGVIGVGAIGFVNHGE